MERFLTNQQMTSLVENELIDVVIVGGGLAGLTAASVLSKSVHIRSVVIVEGRDRLGGRTKTINASSDVVSCSTGEHTQTTIDVGGQWIGPGQDHVLNLIHRFGLILEDQEFTVVPDSLKGQKYCSLIECAHYPFLSHDSSDTVNEFIAILRQAAMEIDLECPWTHPKANKWHELSVEEFVMSYTTTHPDTQAELLLFTQTVLACSPEHISFFFFVFYVASSGGIDALGDGDQGAQKWKIKGGTQQLCDLLAKEMTSSLSLLSSTTMSSSSSSSTMSSPTALSSPPSSSSSLPPSQSSASKVHILFSHRVTNIQQQTHHSDGNQCIVTCTVNDDSTTPTRFHTKHVIFAASPVLIHKLSINFQPPLPAEKICLYDSMVMGACIKIVILYRTSFWTSYRPNQHTTITQAYQKKFGYIHNIFVNNVCCYPTLVCLSTGDSALALSKLPVSERKQAVLEQLVRMYGPEATEYVAYYDEDWSSKSNELSGGCFSGLFSARSPLLDHWSGMCPPYQ